MNVVTFFKELSLVSLFTIVLMSFLHFIPELSSHSTFSWASCLFFIIISILMYLLGYRAAMSTNKNAFTVVIMGFVLFKMVLSVSFIVIFFKSMEPVSHFFLVPFFVVYLIYTIFETYFMTLLAKMNAKTD